MEKCKKFPHSLIERILEVFDFYYTMSQKLLVREKSPPNFPVALDLFYNFFECYFFGKSTAKTIVMK